MKSNLKRLFKITTITSHLKITSKIQKKGTLENLKGKVISNPSFTLSNFLCVATNLEKTNKPFVPRDKNDQICPTALYVHGYILWFSYAFKVCSKSMSEIRYILLVVVVRAAITHKMLERWDKTFISNTWPAESFPRSMWVKKFNLQIPSCTFTSVTMPTHQTLDIFYIYFFGQ